MSTDSKNIRLVSTDGLRNDVVSKTVRKVPKIGWSDWDSRGTVLNYTVNEKITSNLTGIQSIQNSSAVLQGGE